MQNSNSKLNTVLLIIVIILLAVGIWMLSVNEKVVDRIESEQQVVGVIQEGQQEEEKPVVEKPKTEDPFVTFLKSFLTKYDGMTPDIKECYYQGGHQIAVTYDNGGIADGGWAFYDANTYAYVEGCGGFTAEPMPEDSLCRTALPSCVYIYSKSSSSQDPLDGMWSIRPGIDTYNLD